MRRVDVVAVLAAASCAGAWICRLQCQVVNLSNQLSHGSATSTTAGSAVIIMNARVSARMVANTLRFTVCSCLYRGPECHFGSAERRPRKDRLWQGSVRTQTSATHDKTHASRTSARRPPLNSQRPLSKRQPLARPTPKAALATAHGSPQTPRDRRAAAAPLACHNSQRHKQRGQPLAPTTAP